MRVGLHRIGRESELLVVTDEVTHAGKGAERVVVEVRLLLVEAERGAEVAGAGVHEEGVTGAHVHLVHHVVVMVVVVVVVHQVRAGHAVDHGELLLEVLLLHEQLHAQRFVELGVLEHHQDLVKLHAEHRFGAGAGTHV